MYQKLFFKLLPVQILIVAMGSINSIVDGVIAGRYIDAASIGVIGLYYTMVCILQAVGSVLLGGSSILCGRFMGSGDIEGTHSVFSLDLSTAFVTGLIISVISFLFPTQLAVCLGAKNELISPLVSYILGYAVGIVPLLLAQQTAMFLQLERQSVIGYTAVTSLILSNVILDIVFVDVLDMGTFGLALATSISYWIYFLILIPYYFTKKAQLKFSLSRINLRQLVEIARIGFPGAALVFYIAMRNLVINLTLIKYCGNDALSAYASFGMISGLLIAFCLGVGTVVRMMTSIAIGEEDKEGIRIVMKIALTRSMLCSAILGVILAFLSGVLSALFFPDRASSVFILARQLFFIYALCLPMILFIQIYCNYLQACGYNLYVNIQSFIDGFVSLVVPALILAPVIGAMGVWLANPIGLVITILTIFIFVCICGKHFPKSYDDWLCFRKDFGVADNEKLDIVIENLEEVASTAERVQEFCNGHGISHKSSYYAALSLEEMAGNVVLHGFSADKKKHTVLVKVVLKNDYLILRIKDDCIPFDPKERAGQLTNNEPEKNIGIRMVTKLASEMIYQNLLGLNVLTIRFPI